MHSFIINAGLKLVSEPLRSQEKTNITFGVNLIQDNKTCQLTASPAAFGELPGLWEFWILLRNVFTFSSGSCLFVYRVDVTLTCQNRP